MIFSKEARHRLGERGENIAVRLLKRRKHIIVTRNWRVKAGELDIVSLKDNCLHFVEVKTRTWRADLDSFRKLSLRQAKRNRAAAKCYWNALSEKPAAGYFDLIEIVISKRGFVTDIKYTPDYLMALSPLASEAAHIEEENPPSMVNKISGALFFPCPGCGEPHSGKINELCPRCMSKLQLMNEKFFCLECGNDLDAPFAECTECGRRKHPWAGASSLMMYKNFGAELLLNFKFHNQPHLAENFADMALEFLKKHPLKIDAVAAVPMPLARLFSRSYNQAELFAERLAKKLGVPFIKPFVPTLYRVKQSSLNKKERARIRRGRFMLKKSCRLENMNILLVDDVFTTGATLKAAGRSLKKSGMETLYVLSCAYTPRYRKKQEKKAKTHVNS